MANIFFVNLDVSIDDLVRVGEGKIVRVKNPNVNDCVKFINTDMNGRVLLKESSIPESVQEKLNDSEPGSIVLLTDEEFDAVHK